MAINKLIGEIMLRFKIEFNSEEGFSAINKLTILCAS